jgi:hypothetical protein
LLFSDLQSSNTKPRREKRERNYIMKSITQLKTATPPLLTHLHRYAKYCGQVTLALLCFGLSPKAQAVSPPPDGAYPNFTTAEGQNALFSLTTGAGNTAIGWFSLFSVTTGSFNTGVGAGTLVLNTGDQNTATGFGALLLNTTGSFNTANGTVALLNNATGLQNTATGAQALNKNTTGNFNTANGAFALLDNTTGSSNTAIGEEALKHNTDGVENTATGRGALFFNDTGADNTANGFEALESNTTGSFNTANGALALLNNDTGSNNTAQGNGALQGNTAGNFNTAIGDFALNTNTTGSGNTAVGLGALGVGTGGGNTALGNEAGASVTTASNVISIGHPGDNISDSCFIGNIFGATSVLGVGVFVNVTGQLGTLTSSLRFKEEIMPMDKASETLFALKPVTFRYKKGIDPQGIPQFGLVAEDVEAVNPKLVVQDKEGKPYSVRYEAINAMLLNEFLKDHRKVEEQEATIAQQRKDFEATTTELKRELESVVARLKEHDAKIQKVSDQIELSKPAPQVVLNNP